jgi:hypothetical protein
MTTLGECLPSTAQTSTTNKYLYRHVGMITNNIYPEMKTYKIRRKKVENEKMLILEEQNAYRNPQSGTILDSLFFTSRVFIKKILINALALDAKDVFQ